MSANESSGGKVGYQAIRPSIYELIRNAAADQAIEGLNLTPAETENVRRQIELELLYVRGTSAN